MANTFQISLRRSWDGSDLATNPTEDGVRKFFANPAIGRSGFSEVAINVFEVEGGKPKPFSGRLFSFYFSDDDKGVMSRSADEFLVGESWSDQLIHLPGSGHGSDWKIDSKFFVPKPKVIELVVELVKSGEVTSDVMWDNPKLDEHEI